MDNRNEDESSQTILTAASSEPDNSSTLQSSLSSIISNRAAMCKNSVLAFQIQKAIPDVVFSLEKRSSLRSVLMNISEESYSKRKKSDKKQEVIFQIPRKTVDVTEVSVDEYTIAGSKDKLLNKAFVRNLPVNLQDKRDYNSSTGIQEAFLARNKRSNYYSNEVFSAWDYCTDTPKGGQRQHRSFYLLMKANLSEDRIAKEVTARSTKTWLKLYATRIAINLFILFWLFSCYYLIYSVTVYQMRELQTSRLTDTGFRTFLIQFLSSFTVLTLNNISPTLFSVLIKYENYHAQTVTNLSLFRNVFLYLSSIMVLLNTFYQQTACRPKDLCGAGLSHSCHSPRCWETYIGQQLFKLTLTDLFVYIGVFVGVDTVRNYVVKRFNNKLTRLWGPPVFLLPTEVLAPVNSQTILWLGVFYSPMLPAIMVLKLVIIFYIKKTKILKYCEPSINQYRASRFNATFIVILMIAFFTVLIGQTFAIERIPPSRGCGPFRQWDFMTKAVPEHIRTGLSLFTGQWTILITTVLLCIAMNYYYGVIVSQKESTNQMKAQLVLQSCDKQYLLKRIADLTEKSLAQKIS